VFDKDNTLTAPYELHVHDKAASGLQSALDTFGRDQVAILSNSAGTKDDPDYKDAIRIEEAMGISVIRHDEKKPGGLDELMAHFGGVVEDPSQICMVGDRLLTDIVFGNLYGMLTVHTLPLCQGSDNARDNKVASVVRSGENKMLYGDWFGGRMIQKRTIPHKVWPGEETCPLVLPTATND
jgi:phosphatidylglycerophosphatase GEP4